MLQPQILGEQKKTLLPRIARDKRNFPNLGGRKTAQEKKTNSWERRFPRTFRTNVPLILPIFSVFSVGAFFFLILGGFSPS